MKTPTPGYSATILAAAALLAFAVAPIATRAATDLDGYRFRYDFSKGVKNALWGKGQVAEPLDNLNDAETWVPTDGPDGATVAVHPAKAAYGYAGIAEGVTVGNARAINNADWTIATYVRPGDVENGALFSIGQLGGGVKGLVICSSSTPGQLYAKIVIGHKTVSSRQVESTLTLPMSGSAHCFHSVVIVHHASSDNLGTLDFYIDGALATTYKMTTANPFGEWMLQFCALVTDKDETFASYLTDNLETAFTDYRFYSRAFTAADASAYAARYPASKIRHAASIRASGENAVNTGYLTTPATRYSADFQYVAIASQYRIFGARGDMGCNLYISSSIEFAYAMRDGGAGWLGFRNPETSATLAADTIRRTVSLDRAGNKAEMTQNGEVYGTGALGGTANNTANIPTALFAEYKTTDLTPTSFSKAHIYSIAIDEGGTLKHFFAPHYDENLGACFKDIVTGDLKGEANTAATTPLAYSPGVGSSADYKYENSTLYAKLYVESSDTSKGTVAVASGGSPVAEEAEGGRWLARGATFTLTATPAAGYDFLGWFGDRDAITEGTATDATITVSIERAAQLEARFGKSGAEWEERIDSSLPEGLIRLDADGYVQDGLVAHFDGIRNVGAGLPHDSSAATWKNLVAGGPDAALMGDGSWSADGYVFEGGYATFAYGSTFGPNNTIQLATDVDLSAQNYGTKTTYPTFFQQVEKNLGPYMYNKDKTTTTIYCKTDDYGSTSSSDRPSVLWSGKYFTSLLGDGTNRLIVENATAEKTRSKTGAFPAGTYEFGGSADTKNTRAVRGKYHSVRMYEKALSEQELAQNRLIDDARFRSGVEVNVTIASEGADMEGAEANGEYVVNGRHVFTAPNVTKADGSVWTASYRLEELDAATHTWKSAGTFENNTFDYTNCAARAKVRLIWCWKLASGVSRIDADSYIQDGLVVNYDGIRNAGLDAPHDSAAETWKNIGSLGSDYDATFKSWNDTERTGCWIENGYRFNVASTNEYAAMNSLYSFGKDFAIQLVTTFTPRNQANGSNEYEYPSYFNTEEGVNANGMWTRNNAGYSTTLVGAFDYYRPSTWRLNIEGWGGEYATMMLSSAGTAWFFQDATLPAGTAIDITKQPNPYHYTFSGAPYATKKTPVRGVYHAIRIYNRPLTADEIAHNRKIDDVRFRGKVAAFDGAELLQVRSEVPEIELDEAGAYLVCNASKTFTVPASVTVGNRTYAPAGYRLETFDSATMHWSVTATFEGSSVTLGATASGVARRLTWLWTLTNGLRAAADYTAADYVQEGLVANFDGIQNAGTALPHDPTTKWWKNLVPDSPDATLKAWDSVATTGYWEENGYQFNPGTDLPNEYAFLDTALDLGQNNAIQLVTAVDLDEQADSSSGSAYTYPSYFNTEAANNVDGMWTYNPKNTKSKLLIGAFNDYLDANFSSGVNINSNKKRLDIANWDGKYVTKMLSAADGRGWFFETETRGDGAACTVTKNPAAQRYAWSGGGPKTASAPKPPVRGVYHAVRMYTKVLSDAELARNRKVDEIRFRGNFANYANLTIASTQPDGLEEGVSVAGNIADGIYELTGSVTLTAPDVVVGGKTLHPKCKVETCVDGEWLMIETGRDSPYIVTAGENPLRVTWRWVRRGLAIIVR